MKYIQLLVLALSVSTSAACNSDNCYRALFPTASPSAASVASAFCATITSGTVTATNYPTRATAACGTTAARYISACSCATPTTTACATTPTVGLVYGDFNCGFAPWTTQVPDPAATVQIGNPSGNKYLEVDFTPPSVTTDEGVSARITSPILTVTPGTTYNLNWYTFFSNDNAGFIGVLINNAVVWTVDARDHEPVGFWYDNQVSWTTGAGVTSAVIEFDFLFDLAEDTVYTTDGIDGITFVAAS